MNQIQYYRDDLDAALKQLEPSFSSNSNFSTLRDAAYAIFQGQYNQERIADPDDFILEDNFAAPLATGSGTITVSGLYNIFQANLPVDCVSIFSDTIIVERSGTFSQATRANIADLILSGGGATVLAFATHFGKIDLYEKDTTFTIPANMIFYYNRLLDATLPDAHTTPLDIRAQDFQDMVSRVSNIMLGAG